MRRINFKFIYVVVLCIGAAGLIDTVYLQAQSAAVVSNLHNEKETNQSQGTYLVKVGDCISCHSAPGKEPYAGGLPINSPFGVIYSTNITPDKEYGIGNYTLEDFTRALREGVAKDGHHLYPAMPYPSFALASDEDIAAIYNYFMHEVEAVHVKPPETKLSFPFNQRWGIAFWDEAFVTHKHYTPMDGHNESWNRGAYLVQSLGHCGACHTPRGPAFEERGSPNSTLFLSGEILDNWYAVDLRDDNASGLGRWSENDVVNFLKNGHGAGAAAFGNMAQVIENSTQYLNDEDAYAIAHYLKSLTPHGENASYKQENIQPAMLNEQPGAGLYAMACSTCHQATGIGKLPAIPKLAGNPSVLAENPASLIRLLLEGGLSAQTQNSKAQKMPAFGKWTDQEIADVLTFIRKNWGNDAAAVTAHDVAAVRANLKR